MKKTKERIEYQTKRINGKRLMICQNSIPHGRFWQGRLCNEWSNVGEKTDAVLCYKCTMSLCSPANATSGYVSSGRPRGWQFMAEYVDKDGNVFFKGIEQPQLKGTLPSTTVQTKKKISKKEKEELRDTYLQKLVELRADIKRATLKRDINRIMREIKQLERKIKKL